MNLSRDGNPVDEATYTRTTPAMHKMQEITDRLAINTPDLNKRLNQFFIRFIEMNLFRY